MSQGVKRKRADAKPSSRKKKTTTIKPRPVRTGPVNGQDLKWKAVSVSKRLDDAEGFYGLEELSDVEVVQAPNGKGVSFRALIDDVSESATTAQKHESDEEWSGFDGDNQQSTGELENSGNVVDSPIAKSTPSNDSKKLGNLDEELTGNTNFNLLDSDIPEVEVDMTDWQPVELSRPLIYALSALQFASPTQIQRLAIPHILSGKDVIGKAVTGSGKTLAFGVPIIEDWLDKRLRPEIFSTASAPTALILAPTRELAHQISKHLSAICDGLDYAPRLAIVTGGLSILKQQRQLEHADIIVATPGRLWEVISDSDALMQKLQKIRFLVVDEADRLLSEGHFKEVEDIVDALDRKEYHDGETEPENVEIKQSRQILVFSATFHKDLQRKLASKNKKRKGKDDELLSNKQSMEYLIQKLPFQEDQTPAFVDANPDSQLAEKLSETVLECKAMEKDLYLYGYLMQDQSRRRRLRDQSQRARILVFTNSVSAVKRLVPLLQSLDLPSTAISPLHSNMPQKSRLRSLEKFAGEDSRAGETVTSILVATDVAARGLDIKGITTIIHYHVPRTADAYIHRSGRTARVNASGSSVLICSPDETAGVTKLIARLHSSSNAKSGKSTPNVVERMYLPNDLLRQVGRRVELAQNLTDMTQSRDKVKSEDNWLRNAADELGVEYDSDEFEVANRQGRRGRGGEKLRRQKKAAKEEDNVHKAAQWKAQLREELAKRVDFGDNTTRNMKYLAGGALDVDQLLAERAIRDKTTIV